MGEEQASASAEPVAAVDPAREPQTDAAEATATAGLARSLLSGGRAPGRGGAGGADGDVLARLALAPVVARAAALARLQRATGNATLARRLSVSANAVQRVEPDEAALDLDPSEPIELQQGGTAAQTPGAAPVSTRPPLTTTVNNCADCNAAAAILNSGAYVGEASVQAKWEGGGDIKVTKTKKGAVASVAIIWTIDASISTMEVTDFVWPNMTDADKAAVASFKSALLEHEEGHFTVVEAAIAKLPKTITATGGTEAAAVAALQAKVPLEVDKGQKAIDAATATYEGKTKNGKTQSAVGGTNVKLTCPGPAPVPSPATP